MKMKNTTKELKALEKRLNAECEKVNPSFASVEVYEEIYLTEEELLDDIQSSFNKLKIEIPKLENKSLPQLQNILEKGIRHGLCQNWKMAKQLFDIEHSMQFKMAIQDAILALYEMRILISAEQMAAMYNSRTMTAAMALKHHYERTMA